MTISGKIDWTWSPTGVCGNRMFDVDVTVHYRIYDMREDPPFILDHVSIYGDEPDGELKTAIVQDLEADDALTAEICAREGISWTGQGGNDPDGRWKKGD
jgi:hypothetical protein